MTRSEMCLLTMLVLAIALTVFVIFALSMHHADHQQLGNVIASFKGDQQ